VSQIVKRVFPFDVFAASGFPGGLVDRVKPFSMFPPHPWGTWLYGRVFRERCAHLPGDVLEAGVGAGGLSFYFGLLLRELGQERRVFGVDSFEGLPAPNARMDNPYFVQGQYGSRPDDSPLAALLGGEGSPLLASYELAAQGLGVDSAVVPVQGFFEDVLPELEPERRFCFVHVDADLYDSVLCALEHLWDRVVDGGVLAIDDFFHPCQGAARAASEFFNSRGLTPLYHVAFPYSVFVFKEEWGTPPRGVDGNAYTLDWLRRDEFLLEALRDSRERSAVDPRARENCDRLLATLEASPYPGEIYDYWRSLERFWEFIDVQPEEAAETVEA
jgi:Macrocin-O-methyltransferase (TylF)